MEDVRLIELSSLLEKLLCLIYILTSQAYCKLSLGAWIEVAGRRPPRKAFRIIIIEYVNITPGCSDHKLLQLLTLSEHQATDFSYYAKCVSEAILWLQTSQINGVLFLIFGQSGVNLPCTELTLTGTYLEMFYTPEIFR